MEQLYDLDFECKETIMLSWTNKVDRNAVVPQRVFTKIAPCYHFAYTLAVF